MKTTTKKIAAKELANLEVSKSSIAYQIVSELLEITEKKSYRIFPEGIRPVYTSGMGRFCSNQDHTVETIALLSKIGIETKLTNDSPRGGLTGNLITVVTKLK